MPDTNSNSEQPGANKLPESIWSTCGPCAYARMGGPPCYYHTSKFGIGKLTTTITEVAKVVREELAESIEEELNEWP